MCCVGECGRCEQPCGRSLGCGSHRCESRCHPGPCYPCPTTHTITCRCGAASVTLPCGRHRQARPPRCNKPCTLPPDCHHPRRDPHRCHPGGCPFCRQVCGRLRPCNHPCTATCHQKVPVKVVENKKRAGPWEPVVVPHIEIKQLPCPPCQVPVPVTCLGEHETSDFPCSEARIYSCGRKCVRALACTHHKCSLQCHKVEGAPDDTTSGTNCVKCEVRCKQPRPTSCTHNCPRPCHPGPCAQCPTLVKIKCHCAITQLYRTCHTFTTTEGQARETLLSCGNQCSKMMECSHRCPLDCHSGPCGGTGPCQKRVSMRCPCKRLKKDHPCHVVTSGKAKLICDDMCRQKLEECKKAEQEEKRKKQEEEERKQKKELEEFERKMEGRRGRKRNRRQVEEDNGKKTVVWRRYLVAAVVIAVVGVSAAWVLEYV